MKFNSSLKNLTSNITSNLLSNITSNLLSKVKMQRDFYCLLIFAAALLSAPFAHAEKADSLKKTNIKANNYLQEGDTLQLNGSVIVTRGTLLITSEKAVYQERKDGTSLVTLTAIPGTPVFFRQRRDKGTDMWMEGNAERVEYDSKTEIVKLITKASVRYLEKNKVTQSQEGDFLSYDNVNDIFNGKSVSITIEPKEKDAESDSNSNSN